MSGLLQPFGNRKEHATVVKPIIIGTYAFMFSQQEIARRRSRNDNSTHRWHCIVRSPTGEDTSYYIRKVVVTLHSSFINPQRTCEHPPYEISEVGWGEFEIVAKLYFVDPNERPVELRHWLRLYPPGVEDFERYRPPEGPQQCIAVETYDEIFFNDPSERFYEILMSGPLNPPPKYSMEPHFLRNHGKEEYIEAISVAATTTNRNIDALTAKATTLTLEIARLKELYYAAHEDKASAILNREKTFYVSGASISPQASQQGPTGAACTTVAGSSQGAPTQMLSLKAANTVKRETEPPSSRRTNSVTPPPAS